VLTLHLTKTEVKDLIAQNVDYFARDGIVVKVHSGKSLPPMELTAHFFNSKTDSLLNHHYATKSDQERMTRVILRPCVPIGIMGVDLDELKKKCRSNIASMICHPGYTRQVTAGSKSGIYRRALEIIHRYAKHEKVR
jgi:hypothetical protein